MRATTAGKRRSTRDRIADAPNQAPAWIPKNDYENNEAFPGKHVAIFPIKPFADGIVCPTVKTAEAEGYVIETNVPSSITVPEGHQLMSIDSEGFGEMAEEMIAEVEALQNPGGRPQSEDEAKNRIQGAMQGGTFGKIDSMATQKRISLSEMEGNFAQVVLAEQAMAAETAD